MSNLPETSNEYPYLWLSECRKYRIIRCKDDIQHIMQGWQSPKWRNLSYHTDWASISMRWTALTPPTHQPTVSTSMLSQEERSIISSIMGL